MTHAPKNTGEIGGLPWRRRRRARWFDRGSLLRNVLPAFAALPHDLPQLLTRVTVVRAGTADPQSHTLVRRRLPHIESIWVSAWVDVDQRLFLLMYQLEALPLQKNPKVAFV